MFQISQTSDLVIGTKGPHNLSYYRQKLQKLNIHSNTDLKCNVRVEILENKQTRHLYLRC